MTDRILPAMTYRMLPVDGKDTQLVLREAAAFVMARFPGRLDHTLTKPQREAIRHLRYVYGRVPEMLVAEGKPND